MNQRVKLKENKKILLNKYFTVSFFLNQNLRRRWCSKRKYNFCWLKDQIKPNLWFWWSILEAPNMVECQYTDWLWCDWCEKLRESNNGILWKIKGESEFFVNFVKPELNIELNHFEALFNIWMSYQNLSPTTTVDSTWLKILITLQIMNECSTMLWLCNTTAANFC